MTSQLKYFIFVQRNYMKNNSNRYIKSNVIIQLKQIQTCSGLLGYFLFRLWAENRSHSGKSKTSNGYNEKTGKLCAS